MASCFEDLRHILSDNTLNCKNMLNFQHSIHKTGSLISRKMNPTYEVCRKQDLKQDPLASKTKYSQDGYCKNLKNNFFRSPYLISHGKPHTKQWIYIKIPSHYNFLTIHCSQIFLNVAKKIKDEVVIGDFLEIKNCFYG